MTPASSRVVAAKPTKAADGGPSRTLSHPGDRFEQEADRVADAIVSGTSVGRSPFSFVSVPVLQREEAKPGAGPQAPDETEKYKEAARKAGEAFLETAPGREITEKVKDQGEAFVATLPGKVITGAAITGAVTVLAATHKELPLGIPEIPLDRLRPGLKLKLTYEGPVDKPTKVTAAFSVPLGPAEKAEKKPAASASEKFRAETARMAADQQRFRESMKTPRERADDKAEEQRLMDVWLRSRPLVPPPAPWSPTKLSGEVEGPGKPAPSPAELEKKKPEGEVMRKAAGDEGDHPRARSPERLPSASGGEPLDHHVAARLEDRFGVDFSRVRIHTDGDAAARAEQVDALAYTDGTDIVFGRGRYSPHTVDGFRLLAHELAHVVQQAGGSAANALGLTGDVRSNIVRRKETAKTPEPDPVQTALKGDDDAVRDLTKHPKWLDIKLTADQSATLIVHLLDGATLDDDEQAGLAILWKELLVKLLDDTLLALGHQGRFKQLLDDYDGSEYRDLLRLLSENIQQRPTKEFFLDAFIDMWWVRSYEEEAIVILLERTTLADQASLLTAKDRTSELRDAIDDDGYSKRFEIIVASVNGVHGGDLKTELGGPQLSAIFRVKATASVKAGKRTQAEADDLLRRAALELTAELADYQQRLAAAIKDPNSDAGDIARINKEFEKRLKGLIEQKKAEFDIELEYNIELNRALEKSFGKPWSADNLKDFSRDVLAKIPPDILHANPAFKEFRLAGSDPDQPTLGGQAWSARIILYDTLGLSTAAHEVGHTVQYDDNDLYEAFLKLSEWRLLSAADMATEIPDEKARKSLLEKLDADYKKAQSDKGYEGDEREHEGFIYRFARYKGPGQYRRYKKGACFIRDYAASAPDDDFADTFGYYLSDPAALQGKCPEKYTFMHVRVFVEYRLSKQKASILAMFDEETRTALNASSAAAFAFGNSLKDAYVTPVRTELEAKLDAQRAAKVAQAQKTAGAKPVPIPREAQGETLAGPFLSELRALLPALKAVVRRFDHFAGAFLAESITLDNALQDALQATAERLEARFGDELKAVLDPVAERALKGETVDVTSWPELDRLATAYDDAFKVLLPYLPLFSHSVGYKGRFAPRAFALFKNIKDPAAKEKVRLHAVALRDSTYFPAMEKWQNDVLDRIRNAAPFKASEIEDPEQIWKRFEADVRAFAKRAKLQRSPAAGGGPGGDAAAAQKGLDAPSQPLDDSTRGGMESYFGFDFSRVRIHADASAATAAGALNARAFTAGDDVVFGAGQFAPETPEGRGLLAHELTHVVQQSGATPEAGGTEEAPEFDLAFEEVDLPPAPDEAGDEAPEGVSPPPESPPESPPGEQAQPAGAIAAAPLDHQHRSPATVPADDPAEREAARIERDVATLTAITTTSAGPVATTVTGVQRAPAPAAAKPPPGRELVFIMGKDTNKRNPFYSEAVKYFKATLPGATLINDEKHRSLASVFAYLRDNPGRVADLYLVSHANEDGTLSFPLRQGEKVRKTTYGDLREALKKSPELFSVPKGVIDKDTTIHIKGCNIGRSTRMLDALDEAFGGEGKVTAPTHKQVYGTEYTGKGKSRAAVHYEALKVYFIEYKGNQVVKRDEQVAQFQTKYTHLGAQWWEKAIPKKGAGRELVSTPFSYRFNITPKGKEAKAMAVEEAQAKAVAWGEANLSRPEIYEWRLPAGGVVPTAEGYKVTFVAEKTNYVVDKILADETGQRLNPPETDATFFGTSVFGDKAKTAAAGAAGGDDTAALIGELAALDRDLKDATGAGRDAKVARRADVMALLRQRQAFVDVNVVKTEDWLGADEVYVRAGPFKSEVTKLNDGESHSFPVPLASLFPLTAPVTVEVYDEDLGTFFDRDDLIVKMVWQPPFTDLRNTESLDEADYRVKAHV